MMFPFDDFEHVKAGCKEHNKTEIISEGTF